MKTSVRQRFFIICAAILFPLACHGVEIEERVIEKAILEIVYERIVVTDTLIPDKDFKRNVFNLKIGENVSGFYSDALRREDSLEHHVHGYYRLYWDDLGYRARYNSLPQDYLYKYKKESKIITHDRFDLAHWLCEEEWERPEWTVTDSVSSVIGYQCILATCEFRGRKWSAWFTPEIPVQEGPWKLCGLPGLILSAGDDRGHYIFNALEIKTEGTGNVDYFRYHDVIKTNRIRFLTTKWKYLHKDIGYEIVSSGMFGIKPNPGLKRKEKIPHSNYNLEETDFPHE